MSHLPPPIPPSRPVVITENRPVVIEQTAKRYKLMQLAGCLAMMAGAVIGAVGIASGEPSPGQLIATFLSIGGGLLCYIIGRFLAWWFHG